MPVYVNRRAARNCSISGDIQKTNKLGCMKKELPLRGLGRATRAPAALLLSSGGTSAGPNVHDAAFGRFRVWGVQFVGLSCVVRDLRFYFTM